jgi:hypothetical protein
LEAGPPWGSDGPTRNTNEGENDMPTDPLKPCTGTIHDAGEFGFRVSALDAFGCPVVTPDTAWDRPPFDSLAEADAYVGSLRAADALAGVETLRAAVRWADSRAEYFNEGQTADSLLLEFRRVLQAEAEAPTKATWVVIDMTCRQGMFFNDLDQVGTGHYRQAAEAAWAAGDTIAMGSTIVTPAWFWSEDYRARAEQEPVGVWFALSARLYL